MGIRLVSPLKDQAAEMKVTMSEWKLICVLIMMEKGISVLMVNCNHFG